jgi:hypothetical protein
MTSTELTIITAVFFILSALGIGYAQMKAANHYLERIEELLTQIKNGAQAHHDLVQETLDNIEKSVDDVGSNIEGKLDDVCSSLHDLDMALHGDWQDRVKYKQYLNPLKQIEDSVDEIRSNVKMALEPARLRAELRFIRNTFEFFNMVEGASCGELPPEQLLCWSPLRF